MNVPVDVFLFNEHHYRAWTAGETPKYWGQMPGQRDHAWEGTLIPGRYWLVVNNNSDVDATGTIEVPII